MRKAIKAIIILFCIIFHFFLNSCWLFDKDTPWMRKFNRPVFLDLRTERIIEETFSIRNDPDYDINGEYMILINFDISYNEFMNNYVSIEISNDNEILFSNKDKTHITISKLGRLDQIMHIFSLGENINPAVFCFFVLYEQTLFR